ncbi:MAG: hypothetical protein Aurels2KO_11080 [Aureliella sp.]
MEEKRTEIRQRASRLAVLINSENIAYSTTVVDCSEHGLGLEVPIVPSLEVGDNVRVRMRHREIEGTVVRFQEAEKTWQVGLRLDEALGERL